VKLAELSNNSFEWKNWHFLGGGGEVKTYSDPSYRFSGVKTLQPPGSTPCFTSQSPRKLHLLKVPETDRAQTRCPCVQTCARDSTAVACLTGASVGRLRRPTASSLCLVESLIVLRTGLSTINERPNITGRRSACVECYTTARHFCRSTFRFYNRPRT